MSAYLDAMTIFSDGSFRESIELWIGLELIKQDRKTFDYAAYHPTSDFRISEGRRKLLVGHATNVLYSMLGCATDEEMRNMYRYLFVCMNCIKYRLDPKAAKTALNIEEYENKYWRKSC